MLAKYYAIGGTKLCKKYLVNRSEKAIKHRANNRLKLFLDTDVAIINTCGKEKVVYLLDDSNKVIKMFKSIKDASINLGISTVSISAVCNNKIKAVNGYKFCFKSNYNYIEGK